MSFPAKQIMSSKGLVDTIGVSLKVWDAETHTEAGVDFDAVEVPRFMTDGIEKWLLVERTSRIAVCNPASSIEEARESFKATVEKLANRAANAHNAIVETLRKIGAKAKGVPA